ncbi:MAG: hypothetical protein HRT90_08005 [Candidatus Margulisbacteria bacterium]|nr:hypothetical protein [Candidatus Margulisiibacteriota bacterium]
MKNLKKVVSVCDGIAGTKALHRSRSLSKMGQSQRSFEIQGKNGRVAKVSVMRSHSAATSPVNSPKNSPDFHPQSPPTSPRHKASASRRRGGSHARHKSRGSQSATTSPVVSPQNSPELRPISQPSSPKLSRKPSRRRGHSNTHKGHKSPKAMSPKKGHHRSQTLPALTLDGSVDFETMIFEGGQVNSKSPKSSNSPRSPRDPRYNTFPPRSPGSRRSPRLHQLQKSPSFKKTQDRKRFNYNEPQVTDLPEEIYESPPFDMPSIDEAPKRKKSERRKRRSKDGHPLSPRRRSKEKPSGRLPTPPLSPSVDPKTLPLSANEEANFESVYARLEKRERMPAGKLGKKVSKDLRKITELDEEIHILQTSQEKFLKLSNTIKSSLEKSDSVLSELNGTHVDAEMKKKALMEEIEQIRLEAEKKVKEKLKKMSELSKTSAKSLEGLRQFKQTQDQVEIDQAKIEQKLKELENQICSKEVKRDSLKRDIRDKESELRNRTKKPDTLRRKKRGSKDKRGSG